MKRMHVHVAVDSLERSMAFYSNLFAAQPSVVKSDYAKWMLDDPRVNFSISARGRRPGVDHLGIQVEDATELQEVYDRLHEAQAPLLEVGETTCCYARSQKSWVFDPAGLAWEAFLTHGDATVYGHDAEDEMIDQLSARAAGGACCPGDAPVVDGKAAAAPESSCC